MTAPAHGWIISVERHKGTHAQLRQFLVASEDSNIALCAVRELVEPVEKVAIQTRVEGSHIRRRRMQDGDILDVGRPICPQEPNKGEKEEMNEFTGVAALFR